MRPISSTRLRPGPRLLDCSGASDVSSGWGCSSAGAGVAGSSPAAGCALSGWSWTVAPSSAVSVVFLVRAIFVSSLVGGFDGHAISELGPGTCGSPGGWAGWRGGRAGRGGRRGGWGGGGGGAAVRARSEVASVIVHEAATRGGTGDRSGPQDE